MKGTPRSSITYKEDLIAQQIELLWPDAGFLCSSSYCSKVHTIEFVTKASPRNGRRSVRVCMNAQMDGVRLEVQAGRVAHTSELATSDNDRIAEVAVAWLRDGVLARTRPEPWSAPATLALAGAVLALLACVTGALLGAGTAAVLCGVAAALGSGACIATTMCCRPSPQALGWRPLQADDVGQAGAA